MTLTFSIDVSQAGTQMLDRPAAGTQLNYDALEQRGRRKAVPSVIVREDAILQGNKRRRLQANSQDIVRNFAIASWAIRRHLDYVARFDFHSRTKDRGFDRDLEYLLAEQSKKDQFDTAGKISRERFFRLVEARRVIDGDVAILLLQDGRVQGLEGDLIRNREGVSDSNKGPEWIDGILTDGSGRPLKYSIHGRGRGGRGYEWRRDVDASNLIHYGFFERFASEQTRGVSPIVAALNPLRDVYEAMEYALIKAKISQLFALALKRDPAATPMDQVLPGPQAGDDDEEGAEDGESADLKPREINLTNGPTVLDLDVGESADVIESKTPSTEFQAFVRTVTMIALKALDIPYSFFDESHTNYSGSRGSWMHYERSTLVCRDDQAEMRCRWTDFRLQQLVLDGLLTLPSGKDLSWVKYDWVPLGMPWWKPSEEIAGDLKAIASGLDSPQRVVKERGRGDVFDNIEDLIEVIAYAHERGMEVLGEKLRLNFDPGPFASAVTVAGQDGGE